MKLKLSVKPVVTSPVPFEFDERIPRMPRLLAVGNVTWDRLPEGMVLGGSVSYATLAARKLGWEVAAATAAGPDFDPARDMPGVTVFKADSPATTRFANEYDTGGTRRQVVLSRAGMVDLGLVPAAWRSPEVLMLGGVLPEIPPRAALAFNADVVGAGAQGWLRAIDEDGQVHPREWERPGDDLAGVHVLFFSEHDMADAATRARELLEYVPIVAVTRGWRGVLILTRDGQQEVPTLPRREVDPTGAGDVFAAGFLIRYAETGDVAEAAAFGACAASCAVEGVATTSLGDRAEVERRLVLREKYIEEGDWEEED